LRLRKSRLKLNKNDWKTGVSARFLQAAKDGKPDPGKRKIRCPPRKTWQNFEEVLRSWSRRGRRLLKKRRPEKIGVLVYMVVLYI
jgi:hypothetical protein